MHKSTPRVFRIRHACGVAMIEVLISVLLLAVGIMGLVTMQASMSQNATQAKLRSEASFLATQLMGQMWVDVGNLNKYQVTGGACNDTSHVACTAWSNQIASILPSGSANVVVDADNNVTIRLTWTLPGDDAHPNQYQIDTRITN